MTLSFDISSLRQSGLSPRAIAAEALRRIAAYRDPAVWITRVSESAVMARAEALEADPLNRDLPLYGVPFAVKDNIDVSGLPTTAACPAFAYTPTQTAPVVQRLLDAGAILLGKTNLDQFATGLVGTRSPHGAPRCVFDERYISGGSSSGSAVAVAAGLCAFALGTDTAGSGRVPAGFNNIVGLKPSRGLLSTRGVVPACKSLDCVSIFAPSARDAAEIFRIAQGFDAEDVYTRPLTPRPLPPMGFRFGVLAAKDREMEPDMAPLYDAAIDRLVTLGGEAVEFDYAPFAAVAQLLYGGPWVAERYAAIKDFVDSREAAMDPTVGAIITGARSQTAADAFAGQYRLAALKREADAVWAGMDLMLLPTTPAQFTVEEVATDPIGRNARLGRYTNFVNLLDACAIAVPAGFRPNGLAFGVTLIAPAFADRALAALAGRFETGQPAPSEAPEGMVSLFVVGAHLTGMPLNRELTGAGGILLREIRTAPDYRFFALAGTVPPKPGLLRTPGRAGPGILGEVWALTPEAFGLFTAHIPAPLGIGKVALADGSLVSGFLCEAYAVEGAEDITAFGGWRAYLASRTG